MSAKAEEDIAYEIPVDNVGNPIVMSEAQEKEREKKLLAEMDRQSKVKRAALLRRISAQQKHASTAHKQTAKKISEASTSTGKKGHSNVNKKTHKKFTELNISATGLTGDNMHLPLTKLLLGGSGGSAGGVNRLLQGGLGPNTNGGFPNTPGSLTDIQGLFGTVHNPNFQMVSQNLLLGQPQQNPMNTQGCLHTLKRLDLSFNHLINKPLVKILKTLSACCDVEANKKAVKIFEKQVGTSLQGHQSSPLKCNSPLKSSAKSSHSPSKNNPPPQFSKMGGNTRRNLKQGGKPDPGAHAHHNFYPPRRTVLEYLSLRACFPLRPACNSVSDGSGGQKLLNADSQFKHARPFSHNSQNARNGRQYGDTTKSGRHHVLNPHEANLVHLTCISSLKQFDLRQNDLRQGIHS